MFVQQAATAPQSLLVADNSSFLNALFVRDIDSYDRIVVSSGEVRSDEAVRQDNDAVYGFGGTIVTTRFVLPVNEPEDLPDGTPANPAIIGTLRLRQSDGFVTEWQIGKRDFIDDVQIVSGPVAPASVPAGYVIPAFSVVPVWNPINDNRSIIISDVLADRISLTVSWLLPTAAGGPDLSPFPAEPVFESIYGSVLPSSRLTSTFTLPNAFGNGSNGILSGTITGNIAFDGGTFNFRTASFESDQLIFAGGEFSPGFESELVTRARSAAPVEFFHTVTGSVDRQSGTVTLRFAGAEASGGNAGIAAARYLQDPGHVVINATYCVSLQGNGVDGPSGGVTFFAGQDITRQVYVDFPTPGATVNVNSPLSMSPAIIGGDTTIRATNINIAAKMLVNDRLDIGPSLMPTIQASNADALGEILNNRFNRGGNTVRQAYAVAEIVGGQVVRIYTPPGQFGIGYNAGEPPTVTIQPPGTPGGETAMAVAVVDDFGRIAGYNILNPGSGYSSRPWVTVEPPESMSGAEATVGALDSLGGISRIDLNAQGYGYLSPPQVWIAPPPKETGGLQAKARAEIDIVGRVVRLVIEEAGSGYDPAKLPVIEIRGPIPLGSAETVNLDSSIAARVFDIRIGDEVATGDVVRGSLNVSPSGSIAGEIFAGKAAESVFILAQSADVNIEGTVWATKQSYLMQSVERDSELAPFRLTTAARATGLDTGIVKGQDIAVTLANDAPTPAPIAVGGDNAIAFNTVSLRTDIDSLRIRASTRDGVERREPFPYELKLTELNSFSVDAVAASSFPIVITAENDMLFTATLATANDLTLNAGDNFTVSAPVSTTLGRINVSGDNVSVLNSLAVTAAAADETRDDITLTASAGVMTIGGSLRAQNNVSLVQRNRTEPRVSSYANATTLPIPNNVTVTQTIVVSDNFTFDDIDVQVDITHPRVSDLTGTLIAPNGARYALFNRPGLGGPAAANLTGTIFDSEAANLLATGTAPYTGRFRPLDSFALLYGDSVLGTWRLEISDVAPGLTGTLDNFQIFFTSRAGQQGGITGAARIVGERLVIDAEGYVGNPAVLPSNPQFYLQTDVNSLEARAGASIAVDEISDLQVDAIRSGGLVSLRARGVDPVVFGPGHVAALRGNLIDVPQLDVNAPNGSIDIENNAPKTIILGNSDALRRGGAVSMRAGGSVRIRSTGGASFGDLYVLDAPIAGSGARAVRGLASSLPSFTYLPGVPGVTASTLTAAANGGLAIPGLSNLRVGDRLLVNINSTAHVGNGVYAITSVGGASTRWVLTRAADSDTAAETPSNSFVRVTDGPAKGKVYQLTYTPTQTVPFTRAVLGVTETTVGTNIGSDDARDRTTFVVSTAGGTNYAAGSLGKMLQLLQANDTSGSMNPEQLIDFAFSSQVLTPIRLTEQLPSITKRIAIDGNVTYDPPGSPSVNRPRIFVDGSRIVRDRDGNAVTTTSVVHGFEITGGGASGGAIANMIVAGFIRGAAVNITNADAIVVDGMTLGTTDLGARVTNAYGVQVAGSSAGATISGNTTVTASTKAGVRLEGAATNTVLVGITIGAGDRDNNVGVEVATTGANRIGVLPITPAAAIPPVTMTRTSATTFTLPASYRTDAGGLFAGLGVRSDRITVTDGSPAARIAAVATNPTTGVTTITIVGGQISASGSVTFGNFVSTTANTQQLTLPATVTADRLYVGQSVRGTANSGIPTTARIVAIAVDGAGIVTITLSAPLTVTGVTAVTFGAPPRNTVLGNLTGIVLANGATTVNNTTVTANTFDGIRIAGGTNTIGSQATRSAASNVIVGNGGFGIVAATTGARPAAETIAQGQTIRGNFLGVTQNDKSIARRNGKGNVGLRFGLPAVDVVYAGVGNRYVPNAMTLVDAEGNEHSGTPTTSTPTTPTGTPGRRGVPPLPPRRR